MAIALEQPITVPAPSKKTTPVSLAAIAPYLQALPLTLILGV